MNSLLSPLRLCLLSIVFAICFIVQPALANPSIDTLIRNKAGMDTLQVGSIAENSTVLENRNNEVIRLVTYKAEPGTQFTEKDDGTREYPITINKEIVTILSGQEVEVMLPEQILVTIVHEKTVRSSGNAVRMVGFIKEYGKLYRASTIFQGDAIRIKLLTPDGSIRLQSTPEGDFLIDQRGSDRVPELFDDDMVLPPEPRYQRLSYPRKKMALSTNSTIDLMVVYTSGFATSHPGDQLLARLNELVSLANTAYTDSEVNITLRLVHTALVSYSDTTDNYQALDDLTDGLYGFSGVAALRSQYGADLVLLIRPYSASHSGGCGVAWINGMQGYDISLYADKGFSAILDGEFTSGNTTYFCSDFTLTHELGHNMGCSHDRSHSTEGSNGSPYDGAYPYSYGYGIDGYFGTIMSYIEPEVAYFSNPNINSCSGQPCGIDENLSNSANNALSLNNTRAAIANYASVSSCSDSDSDGICDDSDSCPNDPHNDADGDGVCGDVDICAAGDDTVDTDGDGTPDACDTSVALSAAPTLTFSTSGLNVSLSWTSVSGATGYKLYYAPYTSGVEPVYVSADMSTATNFLVPLWDGAAYYVKVTAYNGSSESVYSNTELVTIGINAPTLSASISGFDVSLSWSSVAGATGYTLYYAPNPYQGEQTISSSDMKETTFFNTTLWSGASYYVTITANGVGIESAYSNIELITTP